LVQKGLEDYWKVKQKLWIYNPHKVIAQVVNKNRVHVVYLTLYLCWEHYFRSGSWSHFPMLLLWVSHIQTSQNQRNKTKPFGSTKSLILTTHHISNIFLLNIPFYNTLNISTIFGISLVYVFATHCFLILFFISSYPYYFLVSKLNEWLSQKKLSDDIYVSQYNHL